VLGHTFIVAGLLVVVGGGGIVAQFADAPLGWMVSYDKFTLAIKPQQCARYLWCTLASDRDVFHDSVPSTPNGWWCKSPGFIMFSDAKLPGSASPTLMTAAKGPCWKASDDTSARDIAEAPWS